MINNRYILGERLFEGSRIGELFRARDTLAIQTGSRPQVLIHFISSAEMGYSEYRRISDQLMQSDDITKSNPSILGVLDSGWTGEKGYFVLESPEAWSVNVLPPISASPTSLHRRADKLVRGLRKQHMVNVGLEPSFFLVASNGDLYLLGTALNTFVQKLQPDSGLLSGAVSQYHAKTNTGVLKWLGWSLLAFGSASLAGGIYINRQLISTQFPLFFSDKPISSPLTDLEGVSSQQSPEEPANKQKPELMITLADQQVSPVVSTQTEPEKAEPEKIAIQAVVKETGLLVDESNSAIISSAAESESEVFAEPVTSTVPLSVAVNEVEVHASATTSETSKAGSSDSVVESAVIQAKGIVELVAQAEREQVEVTAKLVPDVELQQILEPVVNNETQQQIETMAELVKEPEAQPTAFLPQPGFTAKINNLEPQLPQAKVVIPEPEVQQSEVVVRESELQQAEIAVTESETQQAEVITPEPELQQTEVVASESETETQQEAAVPEPEPSQSEEEVAISGAESEVQGIVPEAESPQTEVLVVVSKSEIPVIASDSELQQTEAVVAVSESEIQQTEVVSEDASLLKAQKAEGIFDFDSGLEFPEIATISESTKEPEVAAIPEATTEFQVAAISELTIEPEVAAIPELAPEPEVRQIELPASKPGLEPLEFADEPDSFESNDVYQDADPVNPEFYVANNEPETGAVAQSNMQVEVSELPAANDESEVDDIAVSKDLGSSSNGTGAFTQLAQISSNMVAGTETEDLLVVRSEVAESKSSQSQNSIASKQTEQEEPKPVRSPVSWNGMSEQKVLNRAEKALKDGRLQIALYYLRALWRKGVKDGKLLTMIEEVAADQQGKAKVSLAEGKVGNARVAVKQAARLIGEFGLTDLAEIQMKLESDLAKR